MDEFKKYKNWYKKIRKELKNKYGSDYKLFAGLIASTSPKFALKRNAKTAQRIYADYKLNKCALIEDFQNNKTDVLKRYKIINSHYNNILKCLRHDFSKKLVLNGNKVNAFYNNLIGNYHFVTLDVWMMRYFKHSKAWINLSEYKRYSNIIKLKAYTMNLKPCELQAVIWTKIRRENGFKPLSLINFI